VGGAWNFPTRSQTRVDNIQLMPAQQKELMITSKWAVHRTRRAGQCRVSWFSRKMGDGTVLISKKDVHLRVKPSSWTRIDGTAGTIFNTTSFDRVAEHSLMTMDPQPCDQNADLTDSRVRAVDNTRGLTGGINDGYCHSKKSPMRGFVAMSRG